MRNVFDQYSTPENRLTHALATALGEDRKLLRSFIGWVCGSVPVGRLEIVEQQLPGEPEPEEDEDERGSLPDAWIHDGESWSLLIESKVAASLRNDQLSRHLRTAESRGFTDATLMAIAVTRPKRELPERTEFREWSQVYEWLNNQASRSDWANRAARYFEVAEGKMSNEGYLREGSLTKFTGFPFGNGEVYNYLQAKRLLQLAMDELRRRQDLVDLGMNPEAAGRAAITGAQEDGVWDYVPLKGAPESFTAYPHLTLSVQRDRLVAIVILPNGIQGRLRKRIIDLGYEGFRGVMAEVASNISSNLRRYPGAAPILEALQRRYQSQRSVPTKDACLEFDLRTAVAGNSSDGKVKSQPQWLQAAFDAFVNKRSNLQLAVGATFPYRTCKATAERSILDGIAASWIGCSPLLRTMGLS